MSKHTPGPWLVSPDGNVVSGRAGMVERIAVSIFCSKERRDANARLIAAAPQMLDALEAIIKRFQPEQHDAAGCMFKNCELCKAIAAIKAAKGEV